MGMIETPGKAEHRKAICMILAYAVLESTGGVLVKLIPWNAYAIAGYRGLIAGGCTLTYLLVTKTRLRFSRKSLLNGILLGATFTTFITGNKLTTGANAIALQYTAPIFVLLFSAVIYHQKFSLRDVWAALLTIAGIGFFFLDGVRMGGMLGNLISLCSGMALGGSIVAAGNSRHEDRMSGILIGHILTAIVGIPLGHLSGMEVTARAIYGIFAMGIFQVGIPFILYGLGAKHCPPFAVILLSAAEPLLNPIWIFLFVGERPGRFALFGMAIVIATVTVYHILDFSTSSSMQKKSKAEL